MKLLPLITLALLPLSSTPIFAEEPPAQNTTTQPNIAATVTDRSLKFQALAHIPANAEAWMAINLGNTLMTYDKACGEMSIESTRPVELDLIDSVAIAGMSNTPQFIEHTAEALAHLSAYAITEHLQESKNSCTDDATSQALQHALMTESARHTEKLMYALLNAPIPNLYLVVTAKPGYESMLAEAGRRLGVGIRETLGTDGRFFTGNGIHTTRHGLLKTLGVPSMLLEGVDNSDIYLTYRMVGNSLIFTLADKKEKLIRVEKAEDSILATEQCAHIDLVGTGLSMVAAHVAPATLQAIADGASANLQAPFASACKIINTVATLHPQLAEQLQTAITGLQSLQEQLSQLPPCPTKPLNITLWQNGDVHLLAECDACGAEFTTAQVRATAPSNALLHCYGSGLKLPQSPDFSKVYAAVGAVAHGLTGDMSEPYHVASHRLSPLSRMYEGLGSGWVVTVDFAGLGTMYFPYATDIYPPDAISSTPSIRFSLNVADRTLLEQNREAAVGTLVALAGMLDEYAANEVTNMLTYSAQAQEDGSTLFTRVENSRTEEGFAPVCSLTDTELTFATTPNVLRAYSCTPHSTVSGWHLHFNMAPMLNYAANMVELSKARLIWAQQNGIRDDIFLNDLNILSSEQALLSFFGRVISEGKISLTTENGKLRLQLQLTTPCLK